MIGAFTIAFEFEGKTYLALATLKTAENETFYSIHIYDDSLARIIPERYLRYSSKKPLCPSSLHHPNALRLFTCISDAVAYHLQVAKIYR